MWVRVATFEGVDADKMNQLTQERMSAGEMTAPEGMSSAVVLDDADAKKRKFLTFFDSREAIDAAEAGFDKMGDTISEDIRGKRTSVHYYEVVIQDGDIESAKAARVSVLTGSPDTIDEGIDKTRSETLPQVRAIDGNVGAIGLADRDNGRVSMITLWNSSDAMRASEEAADQLRERSAEISDTKIANVARYEVAMAQTTEGARN
jgi:hypothetical protein